VEQRTSNLELFYDLVFVFAVTQVSHLLLEHLSWAGAGRAALVLLVVWSAWNYTTWVTNELDVDANLVRLLLLAIMFASLVLAVAIPEAFGDRALLFAGAYVSIQVGRHLFLTFVPAARGTIERERAGRILTWFCASGVLWIAGAVFPGARIPLWLLALALDWGAPLVLYWVPGQRRLEGDTWDVQVSHFAERFQLFILIALGETVTATGATTSQLDITAARAFAFLVAFVIAAAFWLLYFTRTTLVAQEHLERARDRTTMARNGYTYLHVVLVAGIIEAAVAAEIVISQPAGSVGTAQALAITAGPALYLLGLGLYQWATGGGVVVLRFIAAVVFVALTPLGTTLTALELLTIVGALLVGLVLVEGRRPTTS
jgi:low temperature requirement protein LtrA